MRAVPDCNIRNVSGQIFVVTLYNTLYILLYDAGIVPPWGTKHFLFIVIYLHKLCAEMNAHPHKGLVGGINRVKIDLL